MLFGEKSHSDRCKVKLDWGSLNIQSCRHDYIDIVMQNFQGYKKIFQVKTAILWIIVWFQSQRTLYAYNTFIGKMTFKILLRSVSSWCELYEFTCILISAVKILVLKRIKSY